MIKHDLVQEWMTSTPVTITADVTLPDAHALMKQYAIRRLPVVDESNKLIGIISMSDVLEAQPSDATTLSIYELNYLIAKLTVAKIMTKAVITVSPGTTIAQAARIMRDKKIGGLPVVDKNQLVGIITESDIFRMVVEMTTPVHVEVPNA
jgi:CBS domain-containing protein